MFAPATCGFQVYCPTHLAINVVKIQKNANMSNLNHSDVSYVILQKPRSHYNSRSLLKIRLRLKIRSIFNAFFARCISTSTWKKNIISLKLYFTGLYVLFLENYIKHQALPKISNWKRWTERKRSKRPLSNLRLNYRSTVMEINIKKHTLKDTSSKHFWRRSNWVSLIL